MVQLLYNGMVVSRIESPFQFQTAITVTVHFDASGGRFFGSVVEGANTFDFAFAPQARRHLENNIGIELEGADTQSGATLRATMDNFVIRL